MVFEGRSTVQKVFRAGLIVDSLTSSEDHLFRLVTCLERPFMFVTKVITQDRLECTAVEDFLLLNEGFSDYLLTPMFFGSSGTSYRFLPPKVNFACLRVNFVV